MTNLPPAASNDDVNSALNHLRVEQPHVYALMSALLAMERGRDERAEKDRALFKQGMRKLETSFESVKKQIKEFETRLEDLEDRERYSRGVARTSYLGNARVTEARMIGPGSINAHEADGVIFPLLSR